MLAVSLINEEIYIMPVLIHNPHPQSFLFNQFWWKLVCVSTNSQMSISLPKNLHDFWCFSYNSHWSQINLHNILRNLWCYSQYGYWSPIKLHKNLKKIYVYVCMYRVSQKKSALGNLMIVRTPDSWKHLRGPNRFNTEGMPSGGT